MGYQAIIGKIRNGSFRLTAFFLALLLFATTLFTLIQFDSRKAKAAAVPLESISPAQNNPSDWRSTKGGSVTYDETHAFYMRQNPSLGNQDVVELSAFFPNRPASTSFDIRSGGDDIANNQVCNVTNAAGIGNYITVNIGGVNYNVGSGNVCSKDATKANRFYKTYAGPAPVYDSTARMYRVDITIQYTGATGSNEYVQFRVKDMSGTAKMGPKGDDDNINPNTNFPIIARHTYWNGGANDPYYTGFRIPFGVPCNVNIPATGVLKRIVIFDVDYDGVNWPASDGYKPYYTVSQYDLNGNFTGNVALTAVQYGTVSGDKFYMQGGGNRKTIAQFNMLPGYKYQLNTYALHPRNTINVGLPYSTIWGNVTCTAQVSPQVSLTGTMEEGTPINATAGIFNAGNAIGSVSWDRYFWYEDGGNADKYDAGVDAPLFGGSVPGSTTFNPGPGTTTSLANWGPVTLDGTNHSRICTALLLRAPLSPTYTNITGTNPAQDCRNIIRKPYFQVLNGDVDATGIFPNLVTGVACPTVAPLTGGILAFNNGAASGYTGSGSNLAAFARGTIDQFITGNTHAVANKPRYLSFANAGGYGGGFAQQHCLSSGVIDDFNSAKGGSSGPLTVTQPAVGTSSLTKYVNGDIYITSDITYAAAGFGSFTVDTIPRYKIVATGNIYIQNTVGQIDGVYEAAGKIYTCAIDTGGGNLGVNNSMGDACRARSLTVNGALVAPEVKLLRSIGTVGLMNGPAEVVNFSPEVWLKELRDVSGGPTGTTTSAYDAITNMPPVL
jgi:hypothetical protein